jgi:hypothetical protein
MRAHGLQPGNDEVNEPAGIGDGIRDALGGQAKGCGVEGDFQAEVFKPNGLICLTGWVVVLAFLGSVLVVGFGR